MADSEPDRRDRVRRSPARRQGHGSASGPQDQWRWWARVTVHTRPSRRQLECLMPVGTVTSTFDTPAESEDHVTKGGCSSTFCQFKVGTVTVTWTSDTDSGRANLKTVLQKEDAAPPPLLYAQF